MGMGWGGPPKGLPPQPKIKPGQSIVKVSPERRAELERRADQYFERIDAIAADPSHPQQLNAILALQRRVWGKEKESVEQTGEQTIVIKTGVPRADRD